jgi:uncharacterized protein YueI
MSSEPEKLRKYFDKTKEYAELATKEPAQAAVHLEEAKKYLRWASKYTDTDAEKAEAAQLQQLVEKAEGGAKPAAPAEEPTGPNPEKAKKYLGKAREAITAKNVEDAQKYLRFSAKYVDDGQKAELAEVQAAYDQWQNPAAVTATPAAPAEASAPAPAAPAEEPAGPNPEKAKKFLGKAREAIAAKNLDDSQKYLRLSAKYVDDGQKAELAEVQAAYDQWQNPAAVTATPAATATAPESSPATPAAPAEEAAEPNPEKARKYLGKLRDAITAKNFEDAQKYMRWANKYKDVSLAAEVAAAQTALDQAMSAPAAPAAAPLAAAEATSATPAPTAPAEASTPAAAGAGEESNFSKAKKYLGKAREALAAALIEEAQKYWRWAKKYADDTLKPEIEAVQKAIAAAAAPKPTELKPAASPAKPEAGAAPAAPTTRKTEAFQRWAKFLSTPVRAASATVQAAVPAASGKPGGLDATQLQAEASKVLGSAAAKANEAAAKASEFLQSAETQKALGAAKDEAQKALDAAKGAFGSLFGKKK